MGGPVRATAADAVRRIADGATVAVTGSGGGVLEPDALLSALERRFLDHGQPRGLTFLHAFGLGDRDRRGTNTFAHEGMTRRVIGGHWTWSPRMMDLAVRDAIEAYVWPAGAISLLLREIGAKRPGLITRTGLHTFVDPRQSGGRANAAARDELVGLIEVDGREYLHYRPMRVDVGLIRGTEVDPLGNIGCAEEPAVLDVLAVAQAARASGGTVLAQVKRERPDPLPPHEVTVPGPLVDVVVVAPNQWQTYAAEYDPSLCTALPGRVPATGLTDPVRAAIARRAALEVPAGSVLNVGFGVAAEVVDALAEQDRLHEVSLAIEQGLFNGIPESGSLFGVAHGPTARLASTNQFELFAMGLLDTCCLGMAQLDATGSVNVSRFGAQIVGPGGFVDISQYARKAVFCGTFTAKGLKAEVHDGGLRIVREGTVRKLLPAVEEITYSGPYARAEGREAVYVTERAVFRLTLEGVALVEVAEGVSIERDILPHMGFQPLIGDVKPMPPEVFRPISAISEAGEA
ncbi:MAG: acyl CoA:acetate/3-ketoacid CoA transferase [Actinobacteria bacterium 13_2_20CM_2_71_6]|nr:MAG: acyl CoA:acetate/3-ketoacid CoA transferase [Actinobacteria bacterium 13_2_20CM_2_71_6]